MIFLLEFLKADWMNSRQYITDRRRVIALLVCFVVLSVSAHGQKAVRAASYRTISISSEPEATVWIDGVRYGKTDASGKFTITTIAAGGHSIRVRADGFKETTKPLAATQKGEISIPLAKTTDEAELAFQEAERLISSDREKAAEAYNKAVRLRPKYAEAFIGLARVYSETGEIEKAEKAVRDARRARPGYAEASAVEGRIYKDQGNDEKAIAAFKRAITEGKGFQPEAYTGLGLLYKDRADAFGGKADYDNEDKSYTESAKYFKLAAKQLAGAPDAMVVSQLLGLIYEKQKKFAEAIAVYEEFLRMFPDSSEAGAVRSFIVQLKKQMAEPK
jgi:tetratricopeptide (TPR) repeat protein